MSEHPFLIKYHNKIEIDVENGCHNWIGLTNGSGYGRVHTTMYKRPGMKPAHRVSFHLANPQVDIRNLVVHHKCYNKACVNPEHLEAITHSANIQDGHRHREQLIRGEQ